MATLWWVNLSIPQVAASTRESATKIGEEYAQQLRNQQPGNLPIDVSVEWDEDSDEPELPIKNGGYPHDW